MTDIFGKKEFIEKMWPIAIDEFKRSKIYPHIAIIQSAHESGWGRSGLTLKANNLFGFTGDGWAAEGKPVIYLQTKEFIKGEWLTLQRPFRSYDSWAGSIRDWALLMQKPRYKMAYAAAIKGDIPGFAKEVFDASYATDPEYPFKLIDVYEDAKNLLPPLDDFQGGQHGINDQDQKPV